MQFSEYQNMSSSEKITLAILSASKRLMGWTVHSGSVYKIENFPFVVIDTIEDSGNAYASVSGVGLVTAGKYYLDRSTQTLYIKATDSSNPNSRFIVGTVKVNLANVPITLPHDLDSGFEVYWEPLIKNTSEFGVSIDTIDQTSEAIEGSGSLTLTNDFVFWPAYFDKLAFENQRCILYAFNRDLDVSQKRIIFKGKVEKKNFTKDSVVFSLKDQFAELKSRVEMPKISELSARTGADLAEAFQRTIFGRVSGHVPTNIDQVLDGYPLTGTVSISYNSTTLTGTGTQFLIELSPDDRIILDGSEYTVASVASNTSLTISEEYTGVSGVSAGIALVVPEQPRRYMNRIFNVAGHALRQPITTITSGDVSHLFVASTRDIYAGDAIYVGDLGSGEVVYVDSVLGETHLKLATSLSTSPVAGTQVMRPAVQNVRIDNVFLSYYSDYTFDANTATLTLNESAEANAGPIYQLSNNIVLTNGSRTVTGTNFKSKIFPGYQIGVVNNAVFFEVLSVDSETQLTLRTAATFTANTTGRYKSLVYDPDYSVLSLDVLGKTDDGTTDGVLLKTAPAISKALLTDAGLSDQLDSASFTEAESIAYQHLGIVLPDTYDSTSAPIYRDVLNLVNKSVIGAIVQNPDFQFSYQVLRPKKTTASAKFMESDIIAFTLESTASNIAKTAIVTYCPKEYDYSVKKESIRTKQQTSEVATYILKTEKSKTISTYLVEEVDAGIMASRWSFLLQTSTGRLSFSTKLQAITLQVGDIIEVEHRKFYERFGSVGKRKLLMIESAQKSGASVHIEATDLSNTFNRVACINDNISPYSSSTETEKLYGGYITDEFGLIDNNSDSFETNLIW